MQLKVNPTKGKKATKSGSLQGMCNPLRKIKVPMNLLVMTAILPESDLEKLQFIMQVTPAAHSSGPVHQGRNYGLFVGWVVVGVRVWIEINVGKYLRYISSHREPQSPTNINIQEGKVAISASTVNWMF
jgi:hypothetical protein